MPRLTITYNPDSHESRRGAVRDLLSYVGPKKFRLLVKCIRSGQYSEYQIRFLADLSGVSGFPVTCMLQRYGTT